jgi:xanthine dehydrogenase large subunit
MQKPVQKKVKNKEKSVPTGKSHAHESAHLHVSGEATYVDDLAEQAGTKHIALANVPVLELSHSTYRR